MNDSSIAPKERILCAAIYYHNPLFSLSDELPTHQPKNIPKDGGYVICGRRHHNIIAIHKYLTGDKTKDDSSTQGFLTNTDRFVDREEAESIARAANQLINEPRSVLTSEDLW